MSKGDNYYVDDISTSRGRGERGCFFYGCLFGLILAAAVAILLAVLGYFAYRITSQTIIQYTDTAPMAIPVPDMPEEEVKAIRDRFEAFKKAVDEGQEATLTLTGPELNALLNSDEDIRGRAAVDIEGDQIKGQVSIPFSFPGLGQRYLNGKAAIKASMENGVLIVTLQDLEVKGKPLPPNVMSQLRAENLAKDAYKDPEQAATLRKIRSLTVKDGKITIRSRPPRDEDEEPSEAEAKPEARPDAEKSEPVREAPPEPPAPPAAPDAKAEQP